MWTGHEEVEVEEEEEEEGRGSEGGGLWGDVSVDGEGKECMEEDKKEVETGGT